MRDACRQAAHVGPGQTPASKSPGDRCAVMIPPAVARTPPLSSGPCAWHGMAWHSTVHRDGVCVCARVDCARLGTMMKAGGGCAGRLGSEGPSFGR